MTHLAISKQQSTKEREQRLTFSVVTPAQTVTEPSSNSHDVLQCSTQRHARSILDDLYMEIWGVE
jgi:hypothetical protein